MALIVAFAIAAALTPLVARVATRLGVVDQPGPLKVHERPVPYLGGVAVLVACVPVVALERPSLLWPLGLACLVGLIDDVADVSARGRLVCEIAIGVSAAIVVPSRGVAGALLTVLFVMVLLNAINLLDGLDGLAAGVATVSALAFAIVLANSWSTIALAVGGALLGFLVWNRPPAQIYLGDAGSYLVGTALALLLAAAWGPGQELSLGAGALLFVAVPVADTAVAIVRRARARRPLFIGDRAHVYDQLVDRGWHAPRVTFVCIAAQVALALIGVIVTLLPAVVALPVAASVVIGVAAMAFLTFARAH